jgi:Ca2+-binding RTX toxin-like protein
MATIKGTAGRDTLVGTSLADTIFGGGDDDTIDGGAGIDKMFGESGNDTFLGGDGADTMDGGADVDTVTYAQSSSGVKVNLATGLSYGGQAEGDTPISIENLTGSQHRDILVGSDGRNTINGGQGNDLISAGGDNDVVIGGGGNDTLLGGSGSDHFVFATSRWSNISGVDVIADFQVGVDVLEFRSGGGWGAPQSSVDGLDDLTFSQVGNDTVISFGYHGESITLTGVNLAELHLHASTDFLFS